jgi:hypothetical protein
VGGPLFRQARTSSKTLYLLMDSTKKQGAEGGVFLSDTVLYTRM